MSNRLSSDPAVVRQILIVEDEPIIRNTLAEFLSSEGYQVTKAVSVEEGISRAREKDFHLAICDIQLPDGDGIKLMRLMHKINPSVFVLIITAYGTVESAVEAFKAGAFDYLTKPVIFEDLANKLRRVFEYRDLYLENQKLRRELAQPNRFDQIVGSSEPLRVLQETIGKIAATHSNVLLVGETGTGKELFARAIHSAGPMRDEKFLAVNCGTRPIELLEAELFGSEAGGKTQPGILRTAGGGTVFLDEIASLPMGTQTKLLRAIEYQESMPSGGAETYTVSCRIITSTSEDLLRLVGDGNFEEDLFYRLDGVKIRIPPLRERLDDIPELVDHFVAKHSRALRKRVVSASSETIRLLMSAQWKGNVRQLDNAIERAVIMCDGTQIEPGDLPPDLLGLGQPLPDTDDLRSALRHYERLHITRVLRQWPDKREAAKRLKLGLSSLYRKIEELSIEL
ncbi:sigma-54-dependent transcriptional regulator [Planctomicrobium piriforme]|uniref:Two-component system, NtrC family, response regulator n=1 Tax=Planctomicrobium piriforme TaxID=1576369 RepID=A0A1I3PWH7_9PLAN|nr:sigma-54 dependent transcriptional regulator [Planctomicrobium piriforme]SFJ25702.1 two-component system, NtrC family, response regulator [Planctomicrobium piriforme]